MTEYRRAVTRWALLDGNRLVLATLIVLGTFLALLGLGLVDLIDVDDPEAVRGVATAFVPGLIAFLSIVLGINQLVLSQEFGSAGEIRERIEEIRDYRHDVEAVAGTGPSPVLPIGFLAFVVRTIRAEATVLEQSVDADGVPPSVRERVGTYANAVIDECDEAQASLDRLGPGRINALLPVLEYDDPYQLYEARRLRHDFGEDLPAEARESLAKLIDALELFNVARTQFRTTYTQRVLARLSRHLLYVGVPALLVAVSLGLLPESQWPIHSGVGRLVVVCALLSITTAPIALLAAYLLRIAAVSERTVSAGPFVSRPDDSGAEPSAESGNPSSDVDGGSADVAEDGG